MKKLLLIYAVMAMLLPSCKEIEESINTLENRIDKLEQSISTIDEQIAAIQTTIEALAEIDKSLDERIKTLEDSDDATAEEIAALKDADKMIEAKMADLKKYIDDAANSTKDWVSTTFATLDLLNALSSEVATLKNLVDANKTEVESNLATAIANVESSLKFWVGEQLANYYTIAQVDAKIADLEKVIADGDDALQGELNTLKSQLETAKAELTEAYKKVIEEAINTNKGVIDSKIASEIATVNQRIDNEVATINTKIAAIEARLDNIESKLEGLLARIQSVSYIPTYNDNKATLRCVGAISQVTLDFEISPKDAVAELVKVWESAVSVKAVYTQTRAVSFVDMPIVKFEADAENGIISLVASGENLSDMFFAGIQSASAALTISDGNSLVTSEYVPMVAQVVDMYQLSVPDNEIWYTSSYGEVVIPMDTNAFGAQIVSNTYADGIGVIRFDGNISSIEGMGFHNCTSLTSVNIPDSVTSIGDSAFSYCNSLKSITIPDSVTEIGFGAFSDCNSLEAFYGSNTSSDNRCLIFDGALQCFAPAGLTEYSIPDSVTSIGISAFMHCSSLKSITIPDSATEIGLGAFMNCSSLKSITIPDSVTEIGFGAFSYCNSLEAFYGSNTSSDNRCLIFDGALQRFAPAGLTEYSIPDSVTSIGAGAFDTIEGLTSVTIPESVTEIETCAFWGCWSLTSVYCKGAKPIVAKITHGYDFWDAFEYNVDGRKIYVPRNLVSVYKNARYWSNYASSIEGYDF